MKSEAWQCLTIGAKTVDVTRAEMSYWPTDAGMAITLEVHAEDGGGFRMPDIEFQKISSPRQLAGQRMHAFADGETYPDDTLGTDVIGMYGVSDCNYLELADRQYAFGEIMMDFGDVTSTEVEMTLTCTVGDGPIEDEENTPELYPEQVRGCFRATLVPLAESE